MIAEVWFPYDRRNRRRQNMVLSSAIVCDHDHRMAGDHRSVFPYDRRTFYDLRLSAIISNPALMEAEDNYVETPILLYKIAKFLCI